MEKKRNLFKKVLIYVLTVSVVLSNGMFMNLKKAKAETYYQYLVHFSKPFTMTGSLKNTIEGIMKSSSVLKKSEVAFWGVSDSLFPIPTIALI